MILNLKRAPKKASATKYVSSCGIRINYIIDLFCLLRAPDTSKVKQKMLYASSKDAIRKRLSGIATEIQATDSSEIAYETVLERVRTH